MTATATARDEDLLVSQPDKGVIFLSRRDRLRLVRIPRYPQFGAAGQKVGEAPGQALVFEAGRFFCPDKGTVRLEDGREADAGEILEFLSNHRLRDDVQEGFWRVDPTAPPVSPSEIEALMNAAMELDDKKMAAIVAQEQMGWNRPDLVEKAQAALERIQAAKAQLDPKPAAKKPAAKPE